MKRSILETVNTYLDFIGEFDFSKELSDIGFKIGKLISALSSNDLHLCDKLSNEIVNTTDFDGINFKNVDKRKMSPAQRIKSNCEYLIRCLVLLAFNKISKHELEKEIDKAELDIAVIYKALSKAIEDKKNKE